MNTRENAEMDMPTIINFTVEKRLSTGIRAIRPTTMIVGFSALTRPMEKSSYSVRT